MVTNKLNKQGRKITIRDVAGKAETWFDRVYAAGGDTVWLMDVFGFCGRYKTGESDKGEFIRLYGNFKAINLFDKTEMIAPQCLLPNFISESIISALPPEGGQLAFAYRIGAHYAPDTPTKYQYDVVSLQKMDEKDPLILLEKATQQAALLLEAPKAEEPAKKEKTK